MDESVSPWFLHDRMANHERSSPPSDLRFAATDDPAVAALLTAYFADLAARNIAITLPTVEELANDGADGVVLVAAEGHEPIACGSLRRFDGDSAEVKRMFVAAHARGRGHARRILAGLEQSARSLGYARVVLDTSASLPEAIELYTRSGYQSIPRYNGNPHASLWFEKRLG